MDSNQQPEQPAYRFEARHVGKYVHVTGVGSNSTATLLQFLSDAYKAVRASGCDSALLVLNFAGPSLSLGSIYSVVAERCEYGRALRRIAYVDTNTEHMPDRAELAELAATKLGVNVRMFRHVADAERWLNAET